MFFINAKKCNNFMLCKKLLIYFHQLLILINSLFDILDELINNLFCS